MNRYWNPELIRKHDVSGPRYTSYPTALQFDESVPAREYIDAGRSAADPTAPLSLYVHIPFCAHVCFYCACNKVITANRSRAEPYLQSLYREMSQLADWYAGERVVDQLHWGGGTPTYLSDDQMRALMVELKQHFRLLDDDSGDYSIEIDPRELGDKTLATLREIGFNRVSFGVQDLDPAVQKAVNRIQPLEMTAKTLAEARSLGFRSINLDLIYGLPKQTLASFKQTLADIVALQPDRLSVFNYAHLPERFKTQRQINADELPTAAEKLAILEFTIEYLVSAGYVYIGMDHFAKPDDELAIAQQQNRLHRNFQGYTTRPECDLVAMGVSAISQIGPVYYQNTADISAYTLNVADHSHAVHRGVRLSAEDQLRREVIKQLICNFSLDPAAFGRQHQINFIEHFAEEWAALQTLAGDGLIDFEGDVLRVTDAGRLLVRRICMAFDQYLPVGGSGRFSKIV